MLIGYIISVNESRFKHAHKELLDHEFIPHIAPVVSVKDLNVNAIWNRYKRHNDPTDTTPERTIAVALTHANMWKYGCQTDYINIFEDDVMFQVNATILHKSLEIAKTFRRPFVFMGYCSPNFRKTVYDKDNIMIRECSPICTHAYTSTGNADTFDKMDGVLHRDSLNGHPLFRYNIDVRIRKYFLHENNSSKWPLCISYQNKPLVIQSKFGSDSGHSKKCCAY
jgi:GR25 family glycosyltransferase involved in LPS biosynthesis